MLNKQKVMSMMKQRFLIMIAMCMFCLTVVPVHADDQPNSAEKKLKVYPNPVEKGAPLIIEVPDIYGEMTISLYNTVGKVIQTVKTHNKKVEFNAPDISGIYLLRYVERQKVVAVEKIVVKE
jgi:hypothetical protein